MSNTTQNKVSLTALMAEQIKSESAQALQPSSTSSLSSGLPEKAVEKIVSEAAPATETTAAKKPEKATTKKAKAAASGEPAKKAPRKSGVTMERFGLVNEAQWLLITPSRWEDYKTYTEDFSSLYQGNVAMIRGKIITKKLYDDRGKETTEPRYASRLFAVVANRRGQTQVVTAFGKPGFAWKGYEKGSEIVVRGVPKVNTFKNEMELTQVEVVRALDLGKIHAIYPPVKGSKGDHFAEKVAIYKNLFDTACDILNFETGWDDPITAEKLREVTQFDSPSHLLKELHWPTSVQMAEKAQRATKVLSSWALVRKTNQRISAVEVNPRSAINIDMGLVQELKDKIPFALTKDQSAAIDGICKSLRSPMPMSGLLTGDVGSGKTLAFLVPMVAAHKAGKKVILMTPNLLLIDQVSGEIAKLFPDVNICTVKGAGAGAGIQGDPSKSIIIGTSALLGAMKNGKIGSKADFLVIDEQHKFSVEQREQLVEPHTNHLEATATPIPRTAALATHGAKDLFMLHEVPVEKNIRSKILTRESAKEARNAILEAVLVRGEQAAVIYPIVETDDPQKAIQSVMESANQWSSKVPLERIAVLHGKMKGEEKSAVLKAFHAGEKDLLLSSTVIEVGVTLPELKTMLVLGADNFGVVTLHQLRGRLARHGGDGQFIMFTESAEVESIDRLKLLAQHNDGFILAEKDAEMRGYGDILGLEGDAQSGKTRSLFMGVNITPQHLSFATHLHDKLEAIEKAGMAVDAANVMAKKGESLRLA